MMEPFEKVEKRLECCISNGDCQHQCDKWPDNGCQGELMDDALSLLRAQQERIAVLEMGQTTRLMTPEIVEVLPEGVVVWVEQKTAIGSYISAMVSDGRGNLGNFDLGISVKDVNSRFIKYWTSRPTDEQREAVKWA